MTTYLDRALQAADSARKMHADGDYNAAANRAYYCVFFAAMGLLEAIGDENPGKTHSSLLRRFSERFVLSGEAPREVGRALTVAEGHRSKADYSLAGVSQADSAAALVAMERVLAFARPRLEPNRPEA